ncbi:unnamed protein product [Rhodiola kirilowii]
MLLSVLITNSEGNILVERFNGVPAEERLHWQSFLVKLGADNLRKNFQFEQNWNLDFQTKQI